MSDGPAASTPAAPTLPNAEALQIEVIQPASGASTGGSNGQAAAIGDGKEPAAAPKKRGIITTSVGLVMNLLTGKNTDSAVVDTEIMPEISWPKVTISQEQVFGKFDHVFGSLSRRIPSWLSQVSASTAVLGIAAVSFVLAAAAGIMKSRRTDAASTYLD